MATKKTGKYIGDAGVAKFLAEYKSQTPFHIMRMRVLGALASPYPDLLPVMVVASFWPEDQFPRFNTKDEADRFFQVFMGLWQRLEKLAKAQGDLLSGRAKLYTKEDALPHLQKRLEELDAGFIEGFWGGQDDIKMPSASAALIDGLGEEADAIAALIEDVSNWPDYTPALSEALSAELKERDGVVEDAIKALFLLKEKQSETTH